jgi:hypothetical protein
MLTETEIQWNGKKPPIMETINKTLEGKWASVAKIESGSLICQNIFGTNGPSLANSLESCSYEEKVSTNSGCNLTSEPLHQGNIRKFQIHSLQSICKLGISGLFIY